MLAADDTNDIGGILSQIQDRQERGIGYFPWTNTSYGFAAKSKFSAEIHFEIIDVPGIY